MELDNRSLKTLKFATPIKLLVVVSLIKAIMEMTFLPLEETRGY
jgi:hypothetical protein